LFRIDHFPALLSASSAILVIFEVSFVFLVFSPRGRLLLFLVGLAFHMFTAQFLGIRFDTLRNCYVALLDFGALRRFPRLRGFVSSAPEDEKTPTPPAQSIKAAWLAGTILVVANLWTGARGIDSWPFSVFPAFNGLTP